MSRVITSREFPRASMPKTLAVLLVLSLSACVNLAPDYARPQIPTPDTWPEGPAYQQTLAARSDSLMVADIGWRDFFLNDRLRQIIEMALENNRSLRIAALNVEKVRAMHQLQRSQLFPSVDAQGSGTHQRVPGDLSATGEPMTTHVYAANIGVSAYEVDLFGRLRNLTEAAQEEFFATEEARRATQISLVAEVANTFLLLAADHERLQLARATLDSQLASYKLMQKSFELGSSSALDLRQAQISVEAARVDVARYLGQVAMDENALNLLVGAPVPSMLHVDEIPDASAMFSKLPSGIPSAVLLRRPDILQAEHRLKGANANIGAARANFFPSIFLTGGVGTASSALSNLFKSGTGAWSFIPMITLPIFDAGANTARLESAEADERIAVASYERVIQGAFREVSDALADYGTIDERLSAQRSLEGATTESYRLTDARFKRGADNYFNVLLMQRAMYSAQQATIGVRLAMQANLITLYKTLGGGWQEQSVMPAGG